MASARPGPDEFAGLPDVLSAFRPRAALVLDLASILERAGMTDHRSGGPLCSLTDLVLKLHGERFGRVWQIVETALKLRKNGPSD